MVFWSLAGGAASLPFICSNQLIEQTLTVSKLSVQFRQKPRRTCLNSWHLLLRLSVCIHMHVRAHFLVDARVPHAIGFRLLGRSRQDWKDRRPSVYPSRVLIGCYVDQSIDSITSVACRPRAGCISISGRQSRRQRCGSAGKVREPHYDFPETYSFIPSKLSHFIKERETNVNKDENVEKGTREREWCSIVTCECRQQN